MTRLLLEILSEEIPARMQPAAVERLGKMLAEGLKKKGCVGISPVCHATPRRLVAIIENLPKRITHREEVIRGPRVGAPETAITGFLKKHVAVREQLEIIEIRGSEYYSIQKPDQDCTMVEILRDLIPDILDRFPWPKSMRWGSGTARWVRPVRSILCLLDDQLIPFEWGGIASGNTSYGHRFLSPAPFTVQSVDDYQQKLQAAHVILDARDRNEAIRSGISTLLQGSDDELVEDDALIAENAGLTEWPVPLMGNFDEDFLTIPPEVIRLTMRVNQKYLALRSKKTGKLVNRFIAVANQKSDDGGVAIISGNERVLSARLSDARFFWDNDLRTSLESRIEQLKGLIFHEKIDTVYDRAKRLELLSESIARTWALGDPKNARLAGRLSKADLVTGMVGEFPELQGVMGGYYARNDGLSEDISVAISQHYSPLGPADQVQHEPLAITLALADKIDMLVQFFIIEETPTGSRDPYALRRQALGILRIIMENNLEIVLDDLIDMATVDLPAPVKARSTLLAFFIDRLRIQFLAQGFEGGTIDALLHKEWNQAIAPSKIAKHLRILSAMLKTPEGSDMIIGFKRISSILEIEEEKDGRPYADDSLDRGLLNEEAEQDLIKEIDKGEMDPSEGFEAKLVMVAQLRPLIDAYLDQVVINAEEPNLRHNRLVLLAQLRKRMLGSGVDFSKIAGDTT